VDDRRLEPTEIVKEREYGVLLPNVVHVGVVLFGILDLRRFVIQVTFQNRFYRNRQRCEEHVVERNVPVFEHGAGGEVVVEGVEELGDREEEVLVEEVENEFRDSNVIQPPVIQDQIPQELKLVYREVGVLRSSHPLLPENPNSNVGLQNH
jgi:hypothetical protein